MLFTTKSKTSYLAYIKKYSLTPITCFVFYAFIGCKPRPDNRSQIKEFVQPFISQDIIDTESQIDLPMIPEGIAFTQKRMLLSVAPDQEPVPDYEINFKNISSDECNILKETFTLTYGPDKFRSPINCNNNSFKLKDFLPPLVGALKGNTFRDEFKIENFTLVENLGSNCENLAWEFARFSQEDFHVFFPDTILFNQEFLERSIVKSELLVTAFDSDWKSKVTEFVESAHFGDMISVYLKIEYFDGKIHDEFRHTFIKIDGNLFFEKGNPGDSYPYTYLSTREILDRWNAPSSTGTVFRIFRPKSRFPDARQVDLIQKLMIPNSGLTTTMKYELYKFHLSENGIFSLQENSFHKSSL